MLLVTSHRQSSNHNKQTFGSKYFVCNGTEPEHIHSHYLKCSFSFFRVVVTLFLPNISFFLGDGCYFVPSKCFFPLSFGWVVTSVVWFWQEYLVPVLDRQFFIFDGAWNVGYELQEHFFLIRENSKSGVFIKKVEAQSDLEQVWVPHTLHNSWQKIV